MGPAPGQATVPEVERNLPVIRPQRVRTGWAIEERMVILQLDFGEDKYVAYSLEPTAARRLIYQVIGQLMEHGEWPEEPPAGVN
jgi:hypothetical protein